MTPVLCYSRRNLRSLRVPATSAAAARLSISRTNDKENVVTTPNAAAEAGAPALCNVDRGADKGATQCRDPSPLGRNVGEGALGYSALFCMQTAPSTFPRLGSFFSLLPASQRPLFNRSSICAVYCRLSRILSSSLISTPAGFPSFRHFSRKRAFGVSLVAFQLRDRRCFSTGNTACRSAAGASAVVSAASQPDAGNEVTSFQNGTVRDEVPADHMSYNTTNTTTITFESLLSVYTSSCSPAAFRSKARRLHREGLLLHAFRLLPYVSWRSLLRLVLLLLQYPTSACLREPLLMVPVCRRVGIDDFRCVDPLAAAAALLLIPSSNMHAVARETLAELPPATVTSPVERPPAENAPEDKGDKREGRRKGTRRNCGSISNDEANASVSVRASEEARAGISQESFNYPTETCIYAGASSLHRFCQQLDGWQIRGHLYHMHAIQRFLLAVALRSNRYSPHQLLVLLHILPLVKSAVEPDPQLSQLQQKRRGLQILHQRQQEQLHSSRVMVPAVETLEEREITVQLLLSELCSTLEMFREKHLPQMQQNAQQRLIMRHRRGQDQAQEQQRQHTEKELGEHQREHADEDAVYHRHQRQVCQGKENEKSQPRQPTEKQDDWQRLQAPKEGQRAKLVLLRQRRVMEDTCDDQQHAGVNGVSVHEYVDWSVPPYSSTPASLMQQQQRCEQPSIRPASLHRASFRFAEAYEIVSRAGLYIAAGAAALPARPGLSTTSPYHSNDSSRSGNDVKLDDESKGTDEGISKLEKTNVDNEERTYALLPLLRNRACSSVVKSEKEEAAGGLSHTTQTYLEARWDEIRRLRKPVHVAGGEISSQHKDAVRDLRSLSSRSLTSLATVPVGREGTAVAATVAARLVLLWLGDAISSSMAAELTAGSRSDSADVYPVAACSCTTAVEHGKKTSADGAVSLQLLRTKRNVADSYCTLKHAQEEQQLLHSLRQQGIALALAGASATLTRFTFVTALTQLQAALTHSSTVEPSAHHATAAAAATAGIRTPAPVAVANEGQVGTVGEGKIPIRGALLSDVVKPYPTIREERAVAEAALDVLCYCCAAMGAEVTAKKQQCASARKDCTQQQRERSVSAEKQQVHLWVENHEKEEVQQQREQLSNKVRLLLKRLVEDCPEERQKKIVAVSTPSVQEREKAGISRRLTLSTVASGLLRVCALHVPEPFFLHLAQALWNGIHQSHRRCIRRNNSSTGSNADTSSGCSINIDKSGSSTSGGTDDSSNTARSEEGKSLSNGSSAYSPTGRLFEAASSFTRSWWNSASTSPVVSTVHDDTTVPLDARANTDAAADTGGATADVALSLSSHRTPHTALAEFSANSVVYSSEEEELVLLMHFLPVLCRSAAAAAFRPQRAGALRIAPRTTTVSVVGRSCFQKLQQQQPPEEQPSHQQQQQQSLRQTRHQQGQQQLYQQHRFQERQQQQEQQLQRRQQQLQEQQHLQEDQQPQQQTQHLRGQTQKQRAKLRSLAPLPLLPEWCIGDVCGDVRIQSGTLTDHRHLRGQRGPIPRHPFMPAVGRLLLVLERILVLQQHRQRELLHRRQQWQQERQKEQRHLQHQNDGQQEISTPQRPTNNSGTRHAGLSCSCGSYFSADVQAHADSAALVYVVAGATNRLLLLQQESLLLSTIQNNNQRQLPRQGQRRISAASIASSSVRLLAARQQRSGSLADGGHQFPPPAAAPVPRKDLIVRLQPPGYSSGKWRRSTVQKKKRLLQLLQQSELLHATAQVQVRRAVELAGAALSSSALKRILHGVFLTNSAADVFRSAAAAASGVASVRNSAAISGGNDHSVAGGAAVAGEGAAAAGVSVYSSSFTLPHGVSTLSSSCDVTSFSAAKGAGVHSARASCLTAGGVLHAWLVPHVIEACPLLHVAEYFSILLKAAASAALRGYAASRFVPAAAKATTAARAAVAISLKAEGTGEGAAGVASHAFAEEEEATPVEVTRRRRRRTSYSHRRRWRELQEQQPHSMSVEQKIWLQPQGEQDLLWRAVRQLGQHLKYQLHAVRSEYEQQCRISQRQQQVLSTLPQFQQHNRQLLLREENLDMRRFSALVNVREPLPMLSSSNQVRQLLQLMAQQTSRAAAAVQNVCCNAEQQLHMHLHAWTRHASRATATGDPTAGKEQTSEFVGNTRIKPAAAEAACGTGRRTKEGNSTESNVEGDQDDEGRGAQQAQESDEEVNYREMNEKIERHRLELQLQRLRQFGEGVARAARHALYAAILQAPLQRKRWRGPCRGEVEWAQQQALAVAAAVAKKRDETRNAKRCSRRQESRAQESEEKDEQRERKSQSEGGNLSETLVDKELKNKDTGWSREEQLQRKEVEHLVEMMQPKMGAVMWNLCGRPRACRASAGGYLRHHHRQISAATAYYVAKPHREAIRVA